MPRSLSSRCSSASGLSRRSLESGKSSRSTARSLSEAELRQIAGKVGNEASARYGSLNKALKSLQTDHRGGVSRSEVRNLFNNYGVGRRTADQFFDSVDTNRESTIDVNELKGLLAEEVRNFDVIDLGCQKPIKSPENTDLFDTLRLQERGKEIRLARQQRGVSRAMSEQSETMSDWEQRDAMNAAVLAGHARPTTSAVSSRAVAKTKNDYSAKDLEEIWASIGKAASARYVTVWQAFKSIGHCHGGVTRPDMRLLFHNYGYPHAAADAFFDSVDTDGIGAIDFGHFRGYFQQHIEPLNAVPEKDATYGMPVHDSGHPNSAVIGSTSSKLGHCPDTLAGSTKLSEKEMSKIVETIQGKMAEKFVCVRTAFKRLDVNHKGMIGRPEVRKLFKQFGYGSAAADQLVDMIDTDGNGTIPFGKFRDYFSNAIEPPSGTIDEKTIDSDKPLPGHPVCGYGNSQVHGSTTSKVHGLAHCDKKRISEEELAKAIDNISRAASARYVTTNLAFKNLKDRQLGKITQSGLRKFFNAFGYGDGVADQFLESIGDDGRGSLDYNEFRKHFRAHIEPMDEIAYQEGSTAARGERMSQAAGRSVPNEPTPAWEVIRKGTDTEDNRRSEKAGRLFTSQEMQSSRSASEPPRSFPIADAETPRKQRSTQLRSPSEQKLKETRSARRDETKLKEIAEKLGTVAATKKGQSIRKVLKGIDPDYTGRVSKDEIRDLFKAYNFDQGAADDFFHNMDREGIGDISYNNLQRTLAPHVTPEFSSLEEVKREAALKIQHDSKNNRQTSMASTNNRERNRCTMTDHEFKKAEDQVGESLGKKFRSVADAFRFFSGKCGNLCRNDMRRYFNTHGYSTETADRFFDKLESQCNSGGERGIRFDEFNKHFSEYIRPEAEILHPRNRTESYSKRRVEPVVDAELANALKNIGRKAEQKHGNLRKALHRVAQCHDSTVTREDVREFFQKYGYQSAADKFYDHLDRDNRGGIDYADFRAHIEQNFDPTSPNRRSDDKAESRDKFNGMTTYSSHFSVPSNP